MIAVADGSNESLLDDCQRLLVVDETRRRIGEAAHRYAVDIPELPVRFDLTGLGAGMYVARGRERYIRYNPRLFARYFEENLRDTVAHEVAHYVVDVLFGRRGSRPHGHRWRSVMNDFGVPPKVCHAFDTSDLPVRRQRRFAYFCRCGEHRLSAVRHNRVVARRMRYHCCRCGEVLRMRDG